MGLTRFGEWLFCTRPGNWILYIIAAIVVGAIVWGCLSAAYHVHKEIIVPYDRSSMP
jgi:hypothetical protein